jgi:hypothetical protein
VYAAREPLYAEGGRFQVGLSGASRLSDYRQLESTILQAKASIDKDEFPFATQLTRDATKTMREIQSYTTVRDIEMLYAALKKSKYGKSRPVIELSVDLLKVQHPELFPID